MGCNSDPGTALPCWDKWYVMGDMGYGRTFFMLALLNSPTTMNALSGCEFTSPFTKLYSLSRAKDLQASGGCKQLWGGLSWTLWGGTRSNFDAQQLQNLGSDALLKQTCFGPRRINHKAHTPSTWLAVVLHSLLSVNGKTLQSYGSVEPTGVQPHLCEHQNIKSPNVHACSLSSLLSRDWTLASRILGIGGLMFLWRVLQRAVACFPYFVFLLRRARKGSPLFAVSKVELRPKMADNLISKSVGDHTECTIAAYVQKEPIIKSKFTQVCWVDFELSSVQPSCGAIRSPKSFTSSWIHCMLWHLDSVAEHIHTSNIKPKKWLIFFLKELFGIKYTLCCPGSFILL